MREALKDSYLDFSNGREITISLDLGKIKAKATLKSEEDIDNLCENSFDVLNELNKRRIGINIKKFFGTLGILGSAALALVPAFFFAPIIAAAAFVVGSALAISIGFKVIDKARVDGNKQDLYESKNPDKTVLAPDMRRRSLFKKILEKGNAEAIKKELVPEIFSPELSEEIINQMDSKQR